MLSFFIGENCCAINYFIFDHQSYLFEYLHSAGMALCFGFTTYAVFEGMDRRLISYSDPEKSCAALGLCRSCIKHTDVPCGLRRFFLILIPAHIILCFIPLSAVPYRVSYNTRIFEVFYNYSRPMVHQLFEIRYCPILAIVLLATSIVILVLNRKDPVPLSKLFFAAGMGPLGFSLLRLLLFAPYRDNLAWFDFWEESTELMFIAGVGITLWIFRHGLFAKKAEAPRVAA